MRNIRNANVCVVGGAGFLGSHLVNHLVEDRTCTVLVIDNLVAGRREFIHPRAKFEHYDITSSEESLTGVLASYGIQYLFNYAAMPYVPDSFKHPKRVFNVNCFGAINCINAAQAAGCEGILQVSSAELYGEGLPLDVCTEKPRPLHEKDPVIPHSSYGASKAAVDYYCQSAWRERQTPVIALRQFNCIGERETHPYVLPEIISQIHCQTTVESAKGETVYWGQHRNATVRLGNNSSRDFLYAGDAVRIAVELLERGTFGEVYNLGSETSIKVYDLAKLVGKVMGFADVTVEEDESRKRPWEIWHLQSDNTKAYQAISTTGHRPSESFCKLIVTPLEEAVRRTVKWFEDNGRKWPWEK